MMASFTSIVRTAIILPSAGSSALAMVLSSTLSVPTLRSGSAVAGLAGAGLAAHGPGNGASAPGRVLSGVSSGLTRSFKLGIALTGIQTQPSVEPVHRRGCALPPTSAQHQSTV